MANLGFTGAETGDFSELVSQSGIEIDATVKKTGSYSYKFDSNSDLGRISHTAVDEAFAAFYFRRSSLGSESVIAFRSVTANGAQVEPPL